MNPSGHVVVPNSPHEQQSGIATATGLSFKPVGVYPSAGTAVNPTSTPSVGGGASAPTFTPGVSTSSTMMSSSAVAPTPTASAAASMASSVNYNQAPSGVPNLYIIALPNDFTTEQLVEIFSQFGEIESARLMVSREVPLMPNRSFGFVLFKSVQSAMDAVARGHGMSVGGSTIQVYIARPKSQTSNKPSVYTAAEGFRAPPPSVRRGGGLSSTHPGAEGMAPPPHAHASSHYQAPPYTIGATPATAHAAATAPPPRYHQHHGAPSQHHNAVAPPPPFGAPTSNYPGQHHHVHHHGASGSATPTASAGSTLPPQQQQQQPQFVLAQLPNGQTALVPVLMPMLQANGGGAPGAALPSQVHPLLMAAPPVVPSGMHHSFSASSNSGGGASTTGSQPALSFAAASLGATATYAPYQAFSGATPMHTGSASFVAAAASASSQVEAEKPAIV